MDLFFNTLLLLCALLFPVLILLSLIPSMLLPTRYGDKTPKSFLGRMFGVFWILVGAIMLSLFTALFTNAMQAALDGTKCKDIDGKVVSETC